LQAQSAWSDMALDAPQSARELKLYSKSLMKHGRVFESLAWHLKYLYKRSVPGRSRR